MFQVTRARMQEILRDFEVPGQLREMMELQRYHYERDDPDSRGKVNRKYDKSIGKDGQRRGKSGGCPGVGGIFPGENRFVQNVHLPQKTGIWYNGTGAGRTSGRKTQKTRYIPHCPRRRPSEHLQRQDPGFLRCSESGDRRKKHV